MPNRIIKESITTSVTLATLSDGEERHFWRLLVQADDFGYLDARPEVIRARAYPMMLEKVGLKVSESHTQALVRAGLLHLFLHDGKRYAHFPTWDAHQQKRAKFRKYPQVISCAISCQQLVSSASNGNQLLASAPETLDIRNETLDIRQKKRDNTSHPPITSAATLLALFSEEELQDLKTRFPSVDLLWEAGKCYDYHVAVKGRIIRGRYAFKNWLTQIRKPSSPLTNLPPDANHPALIFDSPA